MLINYFVVRTVLNKSLLMNGLNMRNNFSTARVMLIKWTSLITTGKPSCIQESYDIIFFFNKKHSYKMNNNIGGKYLNVTKEFSCGNNVKFGQEGQVVIGSVQDQYLTWWNAHSFLVQGNEHVHVLQGVFVHVVCWIRLQGSHVDDVAVVWGHFRKQHVWSAKNARIFP